ncbi:ankyrin [Colletotrichum somersetense]|nr:ankyrin [Colletotrichum somersetense]
MNDTSLEFLQILHERGTNLTSEILVQSILRGLQPITQWLLSLNINLNETVLVHEEWNDPLGRPLMRTPLQAAAEQGDITLFERLLALGADINAPPSTNKGGATALQLASIKGYFGLVSRMLDLHADPNAPGAEINGRTALEGAAEHGRLDVVQFYSIRGFKRTATVHTPEGIAKRLEELDRISAEVEDGDCPDGGVAAEASEETKDLGLIKEDSGIHEDSLEEAYILSLPSSTMEEVRKTLKDSGGAPGLPGDAIWAEAYENFSSEYPWLLE